MNYKGYVSSRAFGGMSIPVPAQNSCIREYVSLNGGNYILPNLESSFENCFHQLFGAANNISSGDFIVMYSLTMLPEGLKLDRFLGDCRIKGIGLAFVLENLSVCADFTRVLDELRSYKLADLELDIIGWELISEMYY